MDALFGLMMAKGYERSTVADIVERANVGRSTFYAHYADKDDLLQEALRGLKAHLLAASSVASDGAEPPHPALAFSLPMLEHVVEVRDMIRALASKDTGGAVQKHLHLMLSDLVREQLEASKAASSAPRALVAEFVVGAFLAVCFWWLDNDERLSPAEVAGLFGRLAMPGLAALGG